MKEREQTALRCRKNYLQNNSTGLFFFPFFKKRHHIYFMPSRATENDVAGGPQV